MARHNLLGQLGEDFAVRHLLLHDYHLRHRNWRQGRHEIDIVAEHYGEIVFIEVKTRSNADATAAEMAVDMRKKRFVVEAALAYMAYFSLHEMPFRFDIITITGAPGAFNLTHLQHAFGLESQKRKFT